MIAMKFKNPFRGISIKKEDYHQLAEIFAILSGTWIVGAGMYLTSASEMIFKSQAPELIASSKLLVDASLKQVKNFQLTLYSAYLFAFLSLLYWGLGVILNKDKKKKSNKKKK
jgi:hypothetical protein